MHTFNIGETPEQVAAFEEVIKKYKDVPGCLMPVLQETQGIFGYLPLPVQKAIAAGLGISVSEVYGVATFYSQFRLKPTGKYRISVCLGTACYVKGADKVLKRIEERLGIQNGECTEDRLFSLDSCRCVGACGLAPVMMINDEVYGKLDPDKVDKILDKYMKKDGEENDA